MSCRARWEKMGKSVRDTTVAMHQLTAISNLHQSTHAIHLEDHFSAGIIERKCPARGENDIARRRYSEDIPKF
jgi:hypothetical protein